MLSVLIPANNESDCMAACLGAVFSSRLGPARSDMPVEVIVISNASTDDTVAIAQGFDAQATARGWTLTVLDLEQGGKLNAINQGEAAASGDILIYLDADVEIGADLLDQIAEVLDRPEPGYASGTLFISPAESWATRAYRRIYSKIPFVTHGVPGCGIFAVNRAGRARWQDFPGIISDDTFVRLQFAPHERHGVAASYSWPLVEGFGNLVRVRRRQDIGVKEVAEQFPALMKNDDKPPFGMKRALGMALRDPLGFGVYCAVALAVRLPASKSAPRWRRGR